MAGNKLLNGGCLEIKNVVRCAYGFNDEGSAPSSGLVGRCQKYSADEAFLWMGLVASAAVLAASFFLSGNRAGRNRTIV